MVDLIIYTFNLIAGYFSCKLQVDAPEIQLLNVDKVWKKGFTGKGVVVAVLDDGVVKQEDLEENYVCFKIFKCT